MNSYYSGEIFKNRYSLIAISIYYFKGVRYMKFIELFRRNKKVDEFEHIQEIELSGLDKLWFPEYDEYIDIKKSKNKTEKMYKLIKYKILYDRKMKGKQTNQFKIPLSLIIELVFNNNELCVDELMTAFHGFGTYLSSYNLKLDVYIKSTRESFIMISREEVC